MMEKQTFVKKCKKLFWEHWVCLPWLIGGLENMLDESISKFEYFCCWISLMIIIWHVFRQKTEIRRQTKNEHTKYIEN